MSAARSASGPHPRRAGQGGVAAVEFALLLPMLLSMLSVMVLAVQAFLSYNVMQGAVQSAARFMAATSAGDMTRPVRRLPVVTAARQIVMDAAAASGFPFELDEVIFVMCDGNPCAGGTAPPSLVRVYVLPFALPAGVLQEFRMEIGSTFSIGLEATVPYGG